MTRSPIRRGRATASAVAAAALFLAAGCVRYNAHIHVEPDGRLDVTEKAELLPSARSVLPLHPELAWTSFQASTLVRGGRFQKDHPDSLAGATAHYSLDDWAELGQRGPAFRSFDEVERRISPPNVHYEVKDQYFYKDTTLEYGLKLTEPSGVTVDSVVAPVLHQATGELTVEVPGTVLKADSTAVRKGRVLTWKMAYGGDLDASVTYRHYEWVPMVSVVLVILFLGFLAVNGLRGLRRRQAAA